MENAWKKERASMDSVINNIKFQFRVCLKPDTYNLHSSYFKIISIYMCLYNVWRLLVFAPFLIFILLLLLLLLLSFFSSVAHELVHSRSQELPDRIS